MGPHGELSQQDCVGSRNPYPTFDRLDMLRAAMRYLKLAAVIISVFLGLSGCRTSEDAIVIGSISPLTGENAAYGRSTRTGIELAVEQINARAPLSKPLKVVFEDDRMVPTDGVNALRKLVSVDHVPVVIGPFGSSVVLSTAPVANETKTVIISASATADSIADAGDYVFRIVPPNSKQGSDLAHFCLGKLGAKRAAILYQNNDYGITLRDAFDTAFRAGNGTVVAAEGYAVGATDYKAALTKIKPLKPDVIFFPLHQAEAAIFLRQARELGIDARFVSADGAYTQDLLNAAGNAAEGTFYSTMALAYGSADREIEEFNAAYKAKFGEDPDVYSAYYYEVTNLLANVIRKTGASSEEIRRGLESMSGQNAYHGITGTTSFDARGEVDKAFYIYQVVNGQFKVVGPPE